MHDLNIPVVQNVNRLTQSPIFLSLSVHAAIELKENKLI